MRRILLLLILTQTLCLTAYSQSSGSGTGTTTDTSTRTGTGSGGSNITYSLRCTFDSANDQGFTDAQVIDTAAEGCETGDITVTEDGSTVSVSSNKLSLVGTGAWDTAGVRDTDAMSRTYGGMLFYKWTADGAATTLAGGLKDDSAIGYPELAIQNHGGGSYRYSTENSTYVTGYPSYTHSNEYSHAIITGGYKSDGTPCYEDDAAADCKYGMSVFWVDSNTWKLLHRFSAPNDDDGEYLMLTQHTNAETSLVDDIKIPDPASHTEEDLLGGDPLLALHTFTSDSDTPDKGNAFTDQGNTWTISGGSISNTPGLGSELLTNGDFANWTTDNPDNWTVTGESGSDPEVCEVATGQAHANCGTPGGGFCNIYTTATTNQPRIAQSIMTIGEFYSVSIAINTVTSGTVEFAGINHNNIGSTGTLTFSGRAGNASLTVRGEDTNADVTVDDVSAHAITENELFYTVASGDDEVFITADVTKDRTNENELAGLVIGLDSTSSPTIYAVGYTDSSGSGNMAVRMYLYNNDTGTSIVNDTNEIYSAGAPLTMIRDGNTGYIFYNNKLIGSGDVSNLSTNDRHGLFSTHSTNTFDNLLIQAIGADNEYSDLDSY